MSIMNNKGELVSYECEGLIAELEADIEEFGDIDCAVFMKDIDGARIVTTYDFLEEEYVIGIDELEDDEYLETWKAKDLLMYLLEQNSLA